MLRYIPFATQIKDKKGTIVNMTCQSKSELQFISMYDFSMLKKTTVQNGHNHVPCFFNIISQFWKIIYFIFWESFFLEDYGQGIGIKGKEMALVWHEKASRNALQTSSVNLTHTLLVDTQHDHSQGNCRTMSSIIIKLE